jgi:putative ABC transport system permease protein
LPRGTGIAIENLVTLKATDMQLQPILASLRHHRLTAVLLTLQVALTCAVVCNVAFMIAHRAGQVMLPTGLVEDELSMIQVTGIDKHENSQGRHATDLAALRAIPGVTAAVGVDSLPLGLDESSYGMCASLEALNKATAGRSMQRSSGCVQPSIYSGTPGELATLGLKLVGGRDFVPDEFVPAKPGWVVAHVSSVIVSRSLADRLYHGRSALGRSIYMDDRPPMRIVGIVDTLLRPRLRALAVSQYSVMVPSMPGDSEITYVLRSAPQDRQGVLKVAVETLTRIDPDRLIPSKMSRTFTQMRAQYFQRDRTMIGLLVASGLGLLFVTALGITGLANFWVQQRTRQIGIRRAIGATRGDILRYFQTENFLIVGGGIVFGTLLALVLNVVLMQHDELPRLPPYYLALGAAILWMLGQLAVLGPARRRRGAAGGGDAVRMRTVLSGTG